MAQGKSKRSMAKRDKRRKSLTPSLENNGSNLKHPHPSSHNPSDLLAPTELKDLVITYLFRESRR